MAQNHSVVEPASGSSISPRMSCPESCDIATVKIAPPHPFKLDVNCLQHRAMRALAEIAEENMLNSNIEALSPGIAIGIMIATSLMIWGLFAAMVSFLF